MIMQWKQYHYYFGTYEYSSGIAQSFFFTPLQQVFNNFSTMKSLHFLKYNTQIIMDYREIQLNTKYLIILLKLLTSLLSIFKDNQLTTPLLNPIHYKLLCHTSFFIIINSPAVLQVHNEIPSPLKPPFVKLYK